MRWISFVGGVLIGCLFGLILGVFLGGALGRYSIYSDLCGYDYIFEFEDEASRDAVCVFLRSK